MDLVVMAKICHNHRASYDDSYFVGMAFIGLSAQDKLVLQYITNVAPATP